MTSTLMACMLEINTALTHIQACVHIQSYTRGVYTRTHVRKYIRTHAHTHTPVVGVKGGGDRVAIETVLFQVWCQDNKKKKSSNELSRPTYLMPAKLSEYKQAFQTKAV